MDEEGSQISTIDLEEESKLTDSFDIDPLNIDLKDSKNV